MYCPLLIADACPLPPLYYLCDALLGYSTRLYTHYTLPPHTPRLLPVCCCRLLPAYALLPGLFPRWIYGGLLDFYLPAAFFLPTLLWTDVPLPALQPPPPPRVLLLLPTLPVLVVTMLRSPALDYLTFLHTLDYFATAVRYNICPFWTPPRI